MPSISYFPSRALYLITSCLPSFISDNQGLLLVRLTAVAFLVVAIVNNSAGCEGVLATKEMTPLLAREKPVIACSADLKMICLPLPSGRIAPIEDAIPSLAWKWITLGSVHAICSYFPWKAASMIAGFPP